MNRSVARNNMFFTSWEGRCLKPSPTLSRAPEVARENSEWYVLWGGWSFEVSCPWHRVKIHERNEWCMCSNVSTLIDILYVSSYLKGQTALDKRIAAFFEWKKAEPFACRQLLFTSTLVQCDMLGICNICIALLLFNFPCQLHVRCSRISAQASCIVI